EGDAERQVVEQGHTQGRTEGGPERDAHPDRGRARAILLGVVGRLRLALLGAVRRLRVVLLAAAVGSLVRVVLAHRRHLLGHVITCRSSGLRPRYPAPGTPAAAGPFLPTTGPSTQVPGAVTANRRLWCDAVGISAMTC